MAARPHVPRRVRERRRRELGLALLLLCGLPLALPGAAGFAVGSFAAARRSQRPAALQPKSPSASAAAAASVVRGEGTLASVSAALAAAAAPIAAAAAAAFGRGSRKASQGRSLQALPDLFSPPADEESGGKEHSGPRDFFLFIKDYGWSLRYRVGLASEEECEAQHKLDEKEPLKLQWVKLKKPIKNPSELLQAESWELFDWAVMEPPRHRGFMYHVTRWIDTGVEAVINFFEGRGVKLWVSPDKGIQILLGKQYVKEEQKEWDPKSVTHCWVETMGMPFLPILTSIAFYDLQKVVVDWQA